jgi:transcriptional regulator with XRE-family HTH domain
MEFHEKLQELRKQKGLTQEELAQELFVSRTAVSKWESGRGYPNLDSLKAIAKYFSVSIDSLLSCEEVLTVAEEDHRQKQTGFRAMIFGLLDLSAALFFVLPLFGQKSDGQVLTVALPALTEIALYMKIAYWAVVVALVVWGVLTLTLHRLRSVYLPSLLLSGAGVLLFMISPQPYVAAFLFVLLAIKGLILIKKL